MIKATWRKHTLDFKFDARTSRGAIKQHYAYLISVYNTENEQVVGMGEASPLKGLSIDDVPNFESELTRFTSNLDFWDDAKLNQFPSIKFGLETAILDLKSGGNQLITHPNFYAGNLKIPINGLIWMNEIEHMKLEIKSKVEQGFDTIKIKVGALDYEAELNFIKWFRNEFGAKFILRLDANGGFAPEQALEKLKRLSEFDIHSIEQPIKPKQWEKMADLIQNSPIPIALDEELIGIHYHDDIQMLLKTLKPHYLIIKPTLIGGIKASKTWIEEAQKLGIKFWFTSALESNIGLNAICQLAAEYYDPDFAQGLGTGSLYTNNIESKLKVEGRWIFRAR